MLYILDSMEELKVRLLSEDYGKHLMGVEDLLQKHALVEADINVLGERVKMVVQHSQRFLETEATGGFGPCDPTIIMDRVQQLEVNIDLFSSSFSVFFLCERVVTFFLNLNFRTLMRNWSNWLSSAALAWKRAVNCGNSTGTWPTRRIGSKRRSRFCQLETLVMT